MNSSTALNKEQLFEKVISLEEMNEKTIIKSKELFNYYKSNRIIINTHFEDERWQLCDEYSNVGVKFDISIFEYKKNYETVFSISIDLFTTYLKSYFLLNMGNNVLMTLRNIINNIKKLLKIPYTNLEIIKNDIKFPNHIIEFVSLITTGNDIIKNEIVSKLELIAEYNISMNNNSARELASFQSYFKFNEIILSYWKAYISMDEKLFYYPVYLWWNITAIIPLRPREFLLTPRNCISKKEDKYFLTLRRNKLKGSNGRVNYNISLDYLEVNYQIPVSLFEVINDYIKYTDEFENNVTNTLLRTEAHYAMFNQKKKTNSRFYTYVNLSTTLKMFYHNIIEKRFNKKIMLRNSNSSMDYTDDNIEYIYLGDTRHIAMINIITEGKSPTLAMQLAGHSNIEVSSNYYSNLSGMIECKTVMEYRRLIKGNEELCDGVNYYTSNTLEDYIELEEDARCYSTKFISGDISDCKNVIGDNGEIGFCPNCIYYRINNYSNPLKNNNVYKTKIMKDCEFLNYTLKRYRNGLGYIEDIKQALLKLESSSTLYKNYIANKLINNKE